jgi:iron complex outermembrane recepter protein
MSTRPLATIQRLCLAASLTIPVGLLGQPASTVEVIEVVGATPLGGELDTDRIATHIQTATADELKEQGALDLADFMNRNLGSVFVNEVQSNPLQPDVQYRGFVGSPLLGLPQGLAIYQDGVRINEPFGDTVNWALIPESAIASVYLVPGSNPLFGLNALGGAIAIRTKDGINHAGTRAEVLAGSFDRLGLQAETGGDLGDGFAYFVTATRLTEDGWRDFSPTEAEQLFAKLTTTGERSHVDVTFTHAATELIGNGPLPIDLLEIDRETIFTRPDITENHLNMLAIDAEQSVSDTITLRGNLYVRSSDVATLNGDDSDFAECERTPGFICALEDDGEELVLDENGLPIAADDSLEGAAVNRTGTVQDGGGFALEADFAGVFKGRENHLIAGVSHDDGDVEFAASTELGALDATRQAVAGGIFAGEAFTELLASTASTGVYLSDTLLLGERAAVTLAGRYNRTHIVLADQLGSELNGDHTFQRFNPALGLTLGTQALTFYAGYSEANRAPSPVELTCADENDPCRLPNAFLADPPLEQVVAKTFEAGVRGAWRSGRWHLGLFRTTNADDILFVSAGALTNEGFFDNVGETRREGFEANLAVDAGPRLSWSLDYTYLDATFRDGFVVASRNHPAAIDGEIEVEAGDRLPLIPQQLLKAGVRFAATDALTVGAQLMAASATHFRGDEGNLADELAGYALLGAHLDYALGERASLFLNVDNLLDEEYETFGLFGEADDVLGDDFESPRFVGPGAPRALFIGVRFEL